MPDRLIHDKPMPKPATYAEMAAKVIEDGFYIRLGPNLYIDLTDRECTLIHGQPKEKR